MPRQRDDLTPRVAAAMAYLTEKYAPQPKYVSDTDPG